MFRGSTACACGIALRGAGWLKVSGQHLAPHARPMGLLLRGYFHSSKNPAGFHHVLVKAMAPEACVA